MRFADEMFPQRALHVEKRSKSRVFLNSNFYAVGRDVAFHVCCDVYLDGDMFDSEAGGLRRGQIVLGPKNNRLFVPDGNNHMAAPLYWHTTDRGARVEWRQELSSPTLRDTVPEPARFALIRPAPRLSQSDWRTGGGGAFTAEGSLTRKGYMIQVLEQSQAWGMMIPLAPDKFRELLLDVIPDWPADEEPSLALYSAFARLALRNESNEKPTAEEVCSEMFGDPARDVGVCDCIRFLPLDVFVYALTKLHVSDCARLKLLTDVSASVALSLSNWRLGQMLLLRQKHEAPQTCPVDAEYQHPWSRCWRWVSSLKRKPDRESQELRSEVKKLRREAEDMKARVVNLTNSVRTVLSQAAHPRPKPELVQVGGFMATTKAEALIMTRRNSTRVGGPFADAISTHLGSGLVISGVERRALAQNDHRGKFGVFAAQDLEPGFVVGVYRGTIWEHQEFDEHFLNHVGEDRPLNYAFDLFKRFTVGHDLDENVLGYVNDCRADATNKSKTVADAEAENTEFFPVVWKRLPLLVLVVRKSISQGQEVLVDYGEDYWSRQQSAGGVLMRELYSVLGEDVVVVE